MPPDPQAPPEAPKPARLFAPGPILKNAEAYWQKLGPGLTTGAADDDPSGIATYSQAGAFGGFRYLWLAPLTFPLMAVVQEMCARIGLVTGRGLAANIRAHYPRPLLYGATLLLFAANTFNLGADLGAMAEAVQLLFPGADFIAAVFVFAAASLLLEIFVPYKIYASYLKYLAFILFAYIFSAVLAGLDWSAIIRSTVMPSFRFSREEILLVTAILGTTISPYLFFWQTSQEVEKGIAKGRKTIKARQLTDPAEIRDMRADVWTGMFISNLVMFFIIAACGATLHAAGLTTISSAAEAAEALRPFAGNAAYVLFAVGIIGTGLLTIPVLAGSASYALSETFRWKEGLYRKFHQAYAFYGVIIVAMIIGFLINLLGFDPIRTLLWSAVGNALVAPIILFFIVDLARKKSVMGAYASRPLATALGWFIVAAMTAAGIATVMAF